MEINAGPFRTWITWRDFTFTGYRNRGRFRTREEIEVDGNDPATWIIDSVEAEYVYKLDAPLDRPPLAQELASYTFSEHNLGRILRLSELPEVLAVVVDAFEDYKAAERLSAAQENVQMLEAEVDAVKWHMSAVPEGEEVNPTEHDMLKLEDLTQALSEAREEAQVAHDNALARGMMP